MRDFLGVILWGLTLVFGYSLATKTVRVLAKEYTGSNFGLKIYWDYKLQLATYSLYAVLFLVAVLLLHLWVSHSKTRLSKAFASHGFIMIFPTYKVWFISRSCDSCGVPPIEVITPALLSLDPRYMVVSMVLAWLIIEFYQSKIGIRVFSNNTIFSAVIAFLISGILLYCGTELKSVAEKETGNADFVAVHDFDLTFDEPRVQALSRALCRFKEKHSMSGPIEGGNWRFQSFLSRSDFRVMVLSTKKKLSRNGYVVVFYKNDSKPMRQNALDGLINEFKAMVGGIGNSSFEESKTLNNDYLHNRFKIPAVQAHGAKVFTVWGCISFLIGCWCLKKMILSRRRSNRFRVNS